MRLGTLGGMNKYNTPSQQVTNFFICFTGNGYGTNLKEGGWGGNENGANYMN
jgi:hypothetical protein